MSGDITGTPSGVPDLDDLDDFDVLRLLRGRLDSIISGLDDCIAHGGEAGHPVLLNAGTVYIAGRDGTGPAVVYVILPGLARRRQRPVLRLDRDPHITHKRAARRGGGE